MVLNVVLRLYNNGKGKEIISITQKIFKSSNFIHNSNWYVVQTIKNKFGLLKPFHLQRQFVLSQSQKTVRRKSGWQLQNLKSSGKIESERQFNINEATPFSINLLIKPFLFTATFTSASIAGAAIWQYENVRKKAMTLVRKSWLMDKLNLYGKKKYSWRSKINSLWNLLDEGQKLFVPICFVNVMIFLAWRVPRFQSSMIKYFCSTPFSEAACWPMILSIFSHYNILHLLGNMYVLHSFSSRGVDILGKEQFLGLYLAGGVISSFSSYLYKTVIRNQTLSLGASGAVMGILAYTSARYPDSNLAIVFLPWIVFSAGAGIKFLITADILGVICRWKLFDHAAHLGGAISGLAWYYWGNAYIWQKREPLLQWWHEIRSMSK